MKTKLLRKTGNMTFKVISLDDEKPVGDKDRIKEYIVDLKGTDWCCDCKDYYYRKNICKHIKWVLSQLANKEEIPFEQEGDYDKIIKEVR